MGCGSSSMKGDDTQDDAPKPMKKVATNFNTPDYENAANTERRNTEYAPHDQILQRPSEALSPLTEKKSNPIDKDAIATPAASTQPESAVASTPAAGESQAAQKSPGDDSAPPKEPYKDVTVNSPSSPTAPNVANAFPESHDASKPQAQ